MPVFTTDIMMGLVDTDINEDSDDNKYDDGDHFKCGQPVFCKELIRINKKAWLGLRT